MSRVPSYPSSILRITNPFRSSHLSANVNYDYASFMTNVLILRLLRRFQLFEGNISQFSIREVVKIYIAKLAALRQVIV